MIYLHCGWPKTGTSSLQAALVRHQDRLAAAGIVYPGKWRRDVDGSHNDLVELLAASRESDAALDELRSFLGDHADRDMVLSSENLTLWMLRDERRKILLSFLAAIQEVAPVTCIWTLRRFDDLVCSLYLQWTVAGIELPPPAEWMEKAQPSSMLSGFRQVDDAVTDVTYVKYNPAGGHNSELLRAFGMSAEVAGAIERDLRANPRRNVSLSHKQVVTVSNLDALSARSGVTLDRTALLHAFRHEEFRFDEDRPWVMAGDDARRSLHERVLEFSLRVGFEPYPRFFGDAVICDSRSSSPLSMDPDVLSDEDLSQLLAYLRGRRA